MIQNVTLREKFLIFTKATLTNLRNEEKKPLEISVLFLNWEKIRELPETKECIIEFKKDDKISKHIGKLVGWEMRLATYGVDEYLQHFLMNVVNSDFTFNEEIFNQKYIDLEEFFYQNEFTLRFLVPLINFGSSYNEIELERDAKIIEIDRNTLDEIYFGKKTEDRYLRIKLRLISRAIEVYVNVTKLIRDQSKFSPDKEIFDDYSKAMRIINNIISFLRLFKPGVFGYDRIYTSPLNSLNPTNPTIVSGYPRVIFGDKYFISQEETENLKQMWKDLKIYLGLKPLKMAIKRLNYAHDRKRSEDRIVDYIISFESLFLRDEMELRFKLALRVSTHLGISPNNRKTIFNDISNAYNLRNSIVHGSDEKRINKIIKKTGISLKEFELRIEDYLRRSIVLYIELLRKDENERDIIKILQDRIIQGL